jgi:hypothetical protein
MYYHLASFSQCPLLVFTFGTVSYKKKKKKKKRKKEIRGGKNKERKKERCIPV